jgi:DNA-binding Lrp family transcriptional regulator
VPVAGGWLGLSIGWIADRTGLSPSRVKRALTTLNRAGLLTRTGAGRRFDRRRRRWVGPGWGPVRQLSFAVVRMIGLEVSWQQEQRRRRKARVQQARAAEAPAPLPPPTDPAVARAQVRALRATLNPRAGDPAGATAARQHGRHAAALAAQGLSPAEIRRRLAEASQPP